uniref:Uncharacterized protein n=2 Tax=Micrurus spixii TaxID=129469 RepID=A0A2D4LT88_9SAUR
MRMGDMGPRGALNMGDAFSPAPAGNQGPPPPPMMSMNMNNRGTMPGPAMGPGPSLGPEGATNIGTPMMSDNGTVVMYHKHLLFSYNIANLSKTRITSHCNHDCY